MPSVSEAIPTTGRYRLLGHPTDLAGHVATLGPVPLPSAATPGWREAFVSMLESSGLAGRGGAGFPAAIKLAVAHAAGSGGTILVNAMEGEPVERQGQAPPHQVAASRAGRRPTHGRGDRCAAGRRVRA